MPKRSSNSKKDFTLLAKSVVDQATGAAPVHVHGVAARRVSSAKNPAAVALGRLGGLKGGKARAAKLTAQQRSDAARKAARARWGKQKS